MSSGLRHFPAWDEQAVQWTSAKASASSTRTQPVSAAVSVEAPRARWAPLGRIVGLLKKI